MDDSTVTAPPEFAPGDTTYVGQRAYTVVTNDRGAHVVEQVSEADVAALQAAGYTRAAAVTEMPVVALPDPAPSEPTPEPPPADAPAEPQQAL